MVDNIVKKIGKNLKLIVTVPEINLKVKDENIEFKVEKKSKFNSYIEINSRETGKTIKNKIENGTTSFSIEELLTMADEGIFDFYATYYYENSTKKKRIKYISENQFFKGISKENNLILKSFPTKHKNLSMKTLPRDFNHDISDISLNNEAIEIKGNLSIINDEISKVSKMEVIGKNRIDSKSNIYNLEFSEKNGKYEFNGKIKDIKVTEEELLNSRIDFIIRIYDGDIYYQNPIDLSNYKNYENDENRFLFRIKEDEVVYSFYATEGIYSFALWITTENAFNKSYEISKGRSIYNKACENPINNKMIFFESFFGKSYSGNPKYIYETLLEMGYADEYTFIWSYKGDKEIPGNPIIVNRDEAGDYYKYLAESKYWINNIIFPIHKKRPGNIYLQTWHGTPLKKLGWDITIPGPEVNARNNFHNESRNWNYLISSNEYSSEIFRRAFKFHKEMIELGYPINDVFFNKDKTFVKNLKEKLNIPQNKKIILYAPTWKDDEQNESWDHYFNLEIDLKRLYDKFKDEYFIILKMHHLVSENIDINDEMKNFAIDLSNYDDIQELYLISDLLITDYSSVFFDYAHSKRPILFFVPDLNHYIENVRGLYLNMEKDLPGPLIQNNDELIKAIINLKQISKEYEERYEEFYNKFCSICKGHSGRDIVKKVFK